jgi:hypothetical protein
MAGLAFVILATLNQHLFVGNMVTAAAELTDVDQLAGSATESGNDLLTVATIKLHDNSLISHPTMGEQCSIFIATLTQYGFRPFFF